MDTLLSTTHIVISTDVTNWPADQREQLLKSIAELEAQLHTPDLTEVQSSGWTLDLYHSAMAGLLDRHFVQANAINEAIKAGTGYISRADVYALGGYKDDRTLKGFTRPVNRIMSKLVESGKLPDDAEDLLLPVYDPKISGYQRALGFQVPLEVVKLMQEQQDATKKE
jgi:hypothetical protein